MQIFVKVSPSSFHPARLAEQQALTHRRYPLVSPRV